MVFNPVIFNAALADWLQLFSFPIELLGVILALIEIRFTAVAQYFKELIVGAHLGIDGENKSGAIAESKTMFLILFVAASTSVIILVLFGQEMGPDQGPRIINILFSIPPTIFLIWMLFYLLKKFFALIAVIADGREIGILGILIALIGLYLESYQLLGLSSLPAIAGIDESSFAVSAIVAGIFILLVAYGVLIWATVKYLMNSQSGARKNN